jgi:hypothetical protein
MLHVLDHIIIICNVFFLIIVCSLLLILYIVCSIFVVYVVFLHLKYEESVGFLHLKYRPVGFLHV